MLDPMQQQTTDNVDLQSHNSNDQWKEFDVDFERTSASRFGFSIIGGNKYSPNISIGYIEKGGVADCDGRLKLDDIILNVNNINFQEISHEKAFRELRSAGRYIRMRIRRLVPRFTEKKPLYIQKNSPRLSIVGSMLDEISNNNNVTFTRNITPSNFVGQSQQLPHEIPCINTKPMNQLRNSERQIYTSNSVKEYEVGTHENLKRRLLKRTDLKIHHLIQPDIASTLIPEYKESEAICIALHTSKYHPIPAMSRDQINLLSSNSSPQKILADGIGCNTKPKTIPSPVLLEAIQLHCQRFPHIYKKATLSMLRQDFTTINCDGNELATQIPLMDPSFVGTVQDIMKYGNCVKDLPVKIRRFLEETGTSEICSWENADYSGKYLAHRDTNPLTGRPRFLIVRIVLNDSKTHEKECNDYILITTTHYNKIFLSYK